MIETKNTIFGPQLCTSAGIKQKHTCYITSENFSPLLFSGRSLLLRTSFKRQSSQEIALPKRSLDLYRKENSLNRAANGICFMRPGLSSDSVS